MIRLINCIINVKTRLILYKKRVQIIQTVVTTYRNLNYTLHVKS